MRIAVEDITTFISVIAGVITGLGIIAKFLDNMMKKWVTSLVDPINEKIEDYNNEMIRLLEKNSQEIHNVDLSQCKNFISRYLADMERGRDLTEIEYERFNDILEHYDGIGGNSYVHRKIDKLKDQGKL